MRIGILGTGGIAHTMAKTVSKMQEAGMPEAELYAVGSRNLKKAEGFASEYHMPRAYGTYESFVRDPDIDLIYVATPHSQHYENVKLCLNYGHHVLCEKAFTVTAEQARRLVTLAEEKNLLLTEAIWTRYQPLVQTIRDYLNSGKIGEPTMMTANLSYNIQNVPRLNTPSLAGGALLDLGVYPLNFADMFFGHPDSVCAICNSSVAGLDFQDSYILHYPDSQRLAVLTAGVMGISDRQGVIYGTDGYLIIENINNPQKVTAFDKNHEFVEETKCPPQLTGYEYEVIEAVHSIEEGKTECPSMPHNETVHIMKLMDEIRRQLGVNYPEEILKV